MFTYSKSITQRRQQQSAAPRPHQQSRLSDNRPERVAQRKMAQFISGSAVSVAQRQKIEGLTGNPIQRGGMEDELQMKADQTYQREGMEDELQMKADQTYQREGMEDELQMKADQTAQRAGMEEEMA